LPINEKQKRPIPMFLVGSLFFWSGFSALIYQITWQRSLFTIFGINVEAVTVVVTGFLLGLGFGSLLGGRLSRVTRINLLTLFGMIELAVGLFGFASLDIFRWVGAHTLMLPPAMTTTATIALVVAPTLLMGATLPILTQFLVPRVMNVGRSVGLLYGINTLGSASACFASGLWLMGNLGMQKVILLAAAINLVVAVMAFWLGSREPRDAGLLVDFAKPGLQSKQSRDGLSFSLLFIIAALVGYTSLSYEVIWFREFVIGTNRAPAFALILGTYLGGLAIGAYLIRDYCEMKAVNPVFLLGIAILLSSVLGFLVLPMAGHAAAAGFSSFVGAMLFSVLAQTTIAGAALPLICYLGVDPDRRTGIGVSYLYIANILGSVAGTLITGFVLMDLMSAARISLVLVEVGAIAAVAVVFAGRTQISRSRQIGIATIAVLIAITSPATLGVLFDHFYERLIYKPEFASKPKFVDIVENKNGVVTVETGGIVFGGGMYDGIASVDLIEDKNLLVRPLSLALFHPRPRDVLMVGLATGAWAQIVAANPDVQRLTIVEINPGYLQLIRKYKAVTSILDNPKIEIVIDDGRRWLNRHPGQKFDAIIQNTTWHFRPNVTNLLSDEYLRLSAAHLRDGGIFMYNTTGSKRAMLTGCSVFPYAVREFNMMVGSNAPLKPDYARMRQSLEALTIDSKPVFDLLNSAHSSRIDEIVTGLEPVSRNNVTEDCDSIRRRSQGLSVITDDNMGEEW
jgi:spermidine synthase